MTVKFLNSPFHALLFMSSARQTAGPTSLLLFVLKSSICFSNPGLGLCAQNQNAGEVTKESAAAEWESSKRSVKPLPAFLGSQETGLNVHSGSDLEVSPT